MGGYGALYLAEVLGRSRVAVAVAESPAIWPTAAQTVAGAFDDAADFAAHTIFGTRRLQPAARHRAAHRLRRLRRVRPDHPRAARPRHPTPAGGIEPGGHDSEFWRSQAPAQLRFVGRNL